MDGPTTSSRTENELREGRGNGKNILQGATPRRALGNITNRNGATPGPGKSALALRTGGNSGGSAAPRWACEGVEDAAGVGAQARWVAEDIALLAAAHSRGDRLRERASRAPLLDAGIPSPVTRLSSEKGKRPDEEALYEALRCSPEPLDDLLACLDVGTVGPVVE